MSTDILHNGMAEWIVIGCVVWTVLLLSIDTYQSATSKKRLPPLRVELDNLSKVAMLEGDGAFRLIVRRQSGNVHAEFIAPNAQAAIARAVSTFRRARISDLYIPQNSPTDLICYREVPNFVRRNEGRKVAGIEISRAS